MRLFVLTTVIVMNQDDRLMIQDSGVSVSESVRTLKRSIQNQEPLVFGARENPTFHFN